MTPLTCPRCRRPMEGDATEHGVCPVAADGRPREVALHVWAATYRPAPELTRPSVAEDWGSPLTPAGVRLAVWRGRWPAIRWCLLCALVGGLIAFAALTAVQVWLWRVMP